METSLKYQGLEKVIDGMEGFGDDPIVYVPTQGWWGFIPKDLLKKVKQEVGSCIFSVKRDGNYIFVCIVSGNKMGIGTAIASPLEYTFEAGIHLAGNRAIKAICERKTSMWIRKHLNDFPNDWTKEQIVNVMKCPVNFKSIFKPI